MSPTPLMCSTSTPSLRKGALFLLFADAVQGWEPTNVDCGPGDYINTSGGCEKCTEKTGIYCTTCKKVCIVSDCNASTSGSTELCPIGFSPTGKYINWGGGHCDLVWKYRYQCCRYKENDDSCKLDEPDTDTNVLKETSKYTEFVGSDCAGKSGVAAAVGNTLNGIAATAAALGGVSFPDLDVDASSGRQRELTVFSYSDEAAGTIYFMLHALNHLPESYVERIGFKYEGKNGELCSRDFVPNSYESAYFADEKLQCGDDEIRAWGYNKVHSTIETDDDKINVTWAGWVKYYAQDMKLFIGPFKRSLLDARIAAGKGFHFYADFYKDVGTGRIFVYKWKGEEYTAENQKCTK